MLPRQLQEVAFSPHCTLAESPREVSSSLPTPGRGNFEVKDETEGPWRRRRPRSLLLRAGSGCPDPASPSAPLRPGPRARRTHRLVTRHAANTERGGGPSATGGRTEKREEAHRAGQPSPGCAYLELPPRRPLAPAPPGAAAPPRAAGAARTGAPRPRAPWGARAAPRAGRGAAAGRWALGYGCGGATVGSRRWCRFVRSALCPPRPCPRRSLPARVPAAQLRTEAARHRPRLLVARGRPLPAAGLLGWRWRSPGPRCPIAPNPAGRF